MPDDFDEFDEVVDLDEDEDIPTIDDAMLHRDVDFEAGMSPAPFVSLAITLACIVAFGCQLTGGALMDLKKLRHMGALDAARVRDGEFWRLLSAPFLHANFDHVIGNMIMLYILGMGCEHAFGRLQFLTLYVTAGVCGSLLSLANGRISVGASGAIFGLAGALVTSLWFHRRRLHVRDRRIGLVMLGWAGYQFFISAITPQVDILAHLGGFLAGCLLGLLLEPAVLQGRAEVAARPATRVGVALASAALLYTAIFFIPRLQP